MADSLLFTHNTNILTGLYMLAGYYDHLRCCDKNGGILGYGIQFRHGLDSQYGEIKFIMKNGFEKNKKGVEVDLQNDVVMGTKLVNHPVYVDFHKKKEYKGKELKHRLREEAQRFGERVERTQHPYTPLTQEEFTFLKQYGEKIVDKDVYEDTICDVLLDIYKQSKDTTYSEEEFEKLCETMKYMAIDAGGPTPCRGEEESGYTWCNLQLHIGENVPFTDVNAVLIPRFLLYLDDITLAGMTVPELLKTLQQSRTWKGKMNPFYKKLYFVGTKHYDMYYDYIDFRLSNKFYNYLIDKSIKEYQEGKSTKDYSMQNPLMAIKNATRIGINTSSRISSTLEQYNEEVKVYLKIISTLM
jgi:hypothetical protein